MNVQVEMVKLIKLRIKRMSIMFNVHSGVFRGGLRLGPPFLKRKVDRLKMNAFQLVTIELVLFQITLYYHCCETPVYRFAKGCV